MSYDPISISTAIIKAINEAAMPQPVKAEFTWAPQQELKDDRLRVYVSPSAEPITETAISHDRTERGEIKINVVVSQKLSGSQPNPDNDVQQCNKLHMLLESITTLLRLKKQSGGSWKQSDLYRCLVEHLVKLRQFTAVLTVTYQAGSK